MRYPDLELPEQPLWTRLEYERAGELGLFGPEERLELIEGVIVRKTTQNSPHVQLVENALRLAFPAHACRVQMPLALGDRSEPEPDVAVVAGAVRDYVSSHPRTALLVAEVADSSLTFDRTTVVGGAISASPRLTRRGPPRGRPAILKQAR